MSYLCPSYISFSPFSFLSFLPVSFLSYLVVSLVSFFPVSFLSFFHVPFLCFVPVSFLFFLPVSFLSYLTVFFLTFVPLSFLSYLPILQVSFVPVSFLSFPLFPFSFFFPLVLSPLCSNMMMCVYQAHVPGLICMCVQASLGTTRHTPHTLPLPTFTSRKCAHKIQEWNFYKFNHRNPEKLAIFYLWFEFFSLC